jgi:hypothetical protein
MVDPGAVAVPGVADPAAVADAAAVEDPDAVPKGGAVDDAAGDGGAVAGVAARVAGGLATIGVGARSSSATA